MAVQDRNTLKKFFETGDKPTESQFADLIDSLKHQNDTLTDQEIIELANRLASIESGYIEYYAYNIGDLIFKLVVTQENADDQGFEIGDTAGQQHKQYFLGDAPYTVKAKEFPSEGLGTNEYYYLYWQVHQNYGIQKLFGNNLPTIPEGFEFGVVQGKRFYFQINKQNQGQQINIVNTKIKFINDTGVPIEYRAQGGNWGDIYRTEDTTTDHYDRWDYLHFYYNADLTEETHTIECKIYNADTNQLLMTGFLNAGQNNQHTYGGGQVRAVRNIRIECKKQANPSI